MHAQVFVKGSNKSGASRVAVTEELDVARCYCDRRRGTNHGHGYNEDDDVGSALTELQENPAGGGTAPPVCGRLRPGWRGGEEKLRIMPKPKKKPRGEGSM